MSGSLRAVTRPLSDVSDGPLDLNDVAGADGTLVVRDRVGVAGRGVAATVAVDEATDLLASIDHDGDAGVPGAGPVAIGSLPFEPGAPAELVVPSLSVRKAPDGSAWVTEVTSVGGVGPTASIEELSAGRSTAEHGAYRIAPLVPVEHYLAAVAAARDAVREGAITKAVIARDVEV